MNLYLTNYCWKAVVCASNITTIQNDKCSLCSHRKQYNLQTYSEWHTCTNNAYMCANLLLCSNSSQIQDKKPSTELSFYGVK